MVEQFFSHQEAQQILQIPIGHFGECDQRIWLPEKHGMFTVRSAYHLTQREKEGRLAKAETSEARELDRKMWCKVWKLPIKPKLKHFLWKCLHGWLATNDAVRKRGLHVDIICHRCGLETENLTHLFFLCPESRLVWKLSPVQWSNFGRLTDNFALWWKAVSTAATDRRVQQGIHFSVSLLWQIWKSRNSWQFQRSKIEAPEVVRLARHEWMEFEEGNRKVQVQATPHNSRPTHSTPLPPLSAETTRFWVASESQASTGGAGFGILARTGQHTLLLAKAEFCGHTGNPCLTELAAIRQALQEAQ